MNGLTALFIWMALWACSSYEGQEVKGLNQLTPAKVNMAVTLSTPPTVKEVVAFDDTKIRVIFDKDVEGVSTSIKNFDFDGTITGNNVTATSVNGYRKVYDFIFSSSWNPEETIDLDYSGGNVQSSGASLAELTNRSVDNNFDALVYANDAPKETILWSTSDWHDGNMGFGDNTTHNPFFFVNDSVYWVWIEGDDRRPMVGKKPAGKTATTAYLESVDYQVKDDSHNRFSIGVSSDGYIHISGDMHNYRAGTGRSDSLSWNWMPSRFHNKVIMYWVSDQPWDISSFTYLGAEHHTEKPDGYAFTYQKFFDHPDGTLYFEARNRVYDGGHDSGELGASMWRYETTSRTWTKIGAVPNHPRKKATEYMIQWVDGSQDKGSSRDFYQGAESAITIDHNGRIQVAYAWAVGTSKTASTHVLYQYSDDKGDTFYQADGTSVIMPGTNITADIVVSHAVSDFVSVTAMPDGNAIVGYNNKTVGGSGNSEYAYWTGSLWNTGNDTPTNGTTKDFIHLDRQGIYTWIRHNSNDIRRGKDLSQSFWLRNQDDKVCCSSENAIRETGKIPLLSVDGSKLQIVVLDFKGDGMPSIW